MEVYILNVSPENTYLCILQLQQHYKNLAETSTVSAERSAGRNVPVRNVQAETSGHHNWHTCDIMLSHVDSVDEWRSAKSTCSCSVEILNAIWYETRKLELSLYVNNNRNNYLQHAASRKLSEKFADLR